MSDLNSLAAICIGRLDSAVDGVLPTPLLEARATLHKSMLKSLDDISTAATLLSTQDATSALMTASRRMLELGMLAAQGQVDPIRLIATYLGSLGADFKLGDKNNSSFNWQKDVFPDYQTKDGYWAQATLKSGPIRGILDGHLAVYLFKFTHKKVLDAIDLHIANSSYAALPNWVVELQKLEEGLYLLSSLRTKAGDTYSALSKAVHFEFLGPLTTDFGSQEAVMHVSKALEVAATIGLYVSASDIACSPLDLNKAVQHFFEIALYADNKLQSAL